MIKGILLDLDGTVADTNELIFESFRHTFISHGIENITDEEIYSFFGEPLFRTMERYAPVEEAPNLVNTYREFNESKHDSMIKEFPYVLETLKNIKDMGLKLAIVTSKRKEMAMRSLSRLHLNHFFDLIVSPENTLKHKPDKEPVEYALKELGLLSKEAIMVGDSPYDLLAGKNAGTLTCGVRYTKLNIMHLERTNPNYMIDSFEKLLDIIKELNN